MTKFPLRQLVFFALGGGLAVAATSAFKAPPAEHPTILLIQFSGAYAEDGKPFTTVKALKYLSACEQLKEIFHSPEAPHPVTVDCLPYPYAGLDTLSDAHKELM